VILPLVTWDKLWYALLTEVPLSFDYRTAKARLGYSHRRGQRKFGPSRMTQETGQAYPDYPSLPTPINPATYEYHFVTPEYGQQGLIPIQNLTASQRPTYAQTVQQPRPPFIILRQPLSTLPPQPTTQFSPRMQVIPIPDQQQNIAITCLTLLKHSPDFPILPNSNKLCSPILAVQEPLKPNLQTNRALQQKSSNIQPTVL
jgi:hypothetical protein